MGRCCKKIDNQKLKRRTKMKNENWIQNEKRKSKIESERKKRKLKIEYAIENGLTKMFDKGGNYNERYED